MIEAKRGCGETGKTATLLLRYRPSAPTEQCGAMVGSAPCMRALFREIRQLAGERCPVLVLGETGTGKELAARALHQLGQPGQPWVALNCAAISETLAQSELFGHEKGAFTGAASRHRGAFERADGGTLFLDEVGELSLPLQAQLLRVLETGEYYRVGSDRPLRSVFRLVAATHRDLAREVAAGRFRQDLYFRLSVAVLRTPPLRERREEIPLLAEALLRREPGRELQLDEGALAALMEHAWPGNVRELANTLTRARLRASGETIVAGDLGLPGAAFRRPPSSPQLWVREPKVPWGMVRVEGRTMLEVEREVLLYSLESCGGSQAEAARKLGLPRQTLHDRLRRHGLACPGGDGGEQRAA